MYNLAQGKFEGIPYPTGKLQEEEAHSNSSHSNPQERQQPEAAVTATAPQNRVDTPWPNTMPASTNLFDTGASWPIPPTEAPKVVKIEQAEKRTPPRLPTIPHALVLNKPQRNKPAEKECRWGLHCPICAKSTPKAENTERLEWQEARQPARKLLPPKSQILPSISHSTQIFSTTKTREGMERRK